MIRLVVLADTHISNGQRRLPALVLEYLGGADLIVHLGDFTNLAVVNQLRSIGPLEGVHGNNDSPAVQAIFPARRELVVAGFRLLLLHGHQGGPTALASARAAVGSDAVLFGHSHRPYCSAELGRLLFNPGSPTDRRWGRTCSFGVLTITDRIEAEIIELG